MKKKITLKKRTLEVVEPEKLKDAPGGQTCNDASCGYTLCDNYTCDNTCLNQATCETDCPPTDCC